ncbi:MAG: hydantoinase/oxoprolinase family protein [Candidatus Aquicultor sp.]
MRTVVGIDVGGTFTDFVLLRGGVRTIHKVLSTHPDPEIGVINGLAELGIAIDGAGGIIDIIHGSTIATNALLERKGAKVALVTTQGFTDLIDIGRQNRPQLYSFWADIPKPLVDKECRFGVDERIGAHGEVVNPLKTVDITALGRLLQENDVDSVAICFLFSFLNPSHEQAVEEYLIKNGYFVSASYAILPEYREYERLSTTVINAFVTPLVAKYLDKLSSGIGTALAENLRIMQSNGGLASASAISKRAVETVLSGPAGGTVAAAHLGELTGAKHLISFDMGGTSTDVSLIDGALQFTTEFSLYGSPVKTPMVDIHTVGAGGGSIAWVDAGGALQVGPQSAGSNPGPACYGRGGEPTITDANVVLGRLHPEHFLGGRQRLDIDRAKLAFTTLGATCGLDMQAAANGVLKIAVSNMQKAVRVISVERGHDPRDFTLVAYGGAGPMHACELAEAALIPQVIIPQVPGVFSAFGMTVSDIAKDFSATVLGKLETVSPSTLQTAFIPLLDEVYRYLLGEGVGERDMVFEKSLDSRYVGQSFELTVSLDDFTDDYAGAFHALHKERYGYSSPAEEIEVVTIRARAIGMREKPPAQAIGKAVAPVLPIATTRTYFDRWLTTPCYERSGLLSGHGISGPALVFQLDTTTVIPPGWEAAVDGYGNLLLQRSGPDGDIDD